MSYTNEHDLVVRYAEEKGGSADGQLVIEDVELGSSRDNRINHGIGNEDPSQIQKGNRSHTFSTTAHMNKASARTLQRIDDGEVYTQAVYIRDDDVFTGRAEGMVPKDLSVSSSDGGDTTVSVDADLLGIDWDYNGD